VRPRAVPRRSLGDLSHDERELGIQPGGPRLQDGAAARAHAHRGGWPWRQPAPQRGSHGRRADSPRAGGAARGDRRLDGTTRRGNPRDGTRSRAVAVLRADDAAWRSYLSASPDASLRTDHGPWRSDPARDGGAGARWWAGARVEGPGADPRHA